MGRTDGGGTERIVGGREGKGAKKKSKEYSARRVRKRGGERGGGQKGEKQEWWAKRWAGKAGGGGGDRKV
jgi:hypothetical protein